MDVTAIAWDKALFPEDPKVSGLLGAEADDDAKVLQLSVSERRESLLVKGDRLVVLLHRGVDCEMGDRHLDGGEFGTQQG